MKLGTTVVPATITRTGKRILITLTNPLEIAACETLNVKIAA